MTVEELSAVEEVVEKSRTGLDRSKIQVYRSRGLLLAGACPESVESYSGCGGNALSLSLDLRVEQWHVCGEEAASKYKDTAKEGKVVSIQQVDTGADVFGSAVEQLA